MSPCIAAMAGGTGTCVFTFLGFVVPVLMVFMSVVSFCQMLWSITSDRPDSSYLERFYGFSALGYLFIAIVYGVIAGIGVI